MRQGFDNAKYIELQAAHIKERISQFGGKLYLEFGGKLFDDYHASRVLPGFEPDSKFRMLKSIADDVEVIIAINANHIEKNKARGDLGITYDEDVLRLVDLFRGNGFAVAAVVITQYAGQPAADVFRNRLNALGIPAKLHYPIEGYPHDVDLIVSDDGYGKNEFVDYDVTGNKTARFETSIGRIIFNRQCLPEDYEFMNYKMVKGDVAKLVADCCDRYPEAKVGPILDAIKYSGFHYATRALSLIHI